MRLHILGIAGTFMAGLARLAHQCGHSVSGSDENIYPPMSTQLAQMGIKLYPKDCLPGGGKGADHYVVGNVMSRSMPAVEDLLDQGLSYSSGPQWLYDNILRTRRVFAVAGTHGKTTTSSMLAWILRHNGIDAGYLIGGIPENFQTSAELGSADCFVIEADEYDTAFFDKRPKFLHYQPEVLVLNNLEHDHIDIYPRLSDVRRAFHQLIRQLPGKAQIIARADDINIRKVLKQGLWSGLTLFNDRKSWRADESDGVCQISEGRQPRGRLQLRTDTGYNRLNALAALLAATHAGVDIASALDALQSFQGVRRRLQRLHKSGRTGLYEDFAHHPTAIACVVEVFAGRIRRAGQGRLLLFIEAGSYSMRAGHQLARLLTIVSRADRVWLYTPEKTLYNEALIKLESRPGKDRVQISHRVADLLGPACADVRAGDQLVILSNRHFGGRISEIRERLIEAIDALAQKAET